MNDKIQIGDRVKVVFTDGEKETGETIEGILTYLAEDEPYCEIDGKGVNLASEGHSSYFEKLSR